MTQPLSSNLAWSLMNPILARVLNPIISNIWLQGVQVSGLVMIANTPNSFNHGLGRAPKGWALVDNTASATIWRTQNFNSTSLTLESSANTTISVWIF